MDSIGYTMRKTGDVIASLFCLFIGTVVTIGSIRLDVGTPTEPEPGFFPFISGILLIVLSVMLLVYALLGRSSGIQKLGDLGRPGILVAGLFIYSLILDFAGYMISTVILSSVVLYVMEVRIIWKIAAISIFMAIVSYILFDRLLGITLPLGILEPLLL